MKTSATFLSCIAVACALALPAAADTVAWWHFDEDAPGEKAAASTIAPDQAPTLYAEPEAMNGTTVYTAGSDEYEASAYAPAYTKPFRGRVIYDPVSDTYRTNSAAMRFATANGTYPAQYGGCIKVPNTQSLLSPCSAAFTVEAFVCTTGNTTSVANNFAPLVASVEGTSFTSEPWALYMDVTSSGLGGLSFRLKTSAGACVKYQGNATSTKINDGNWHHVAYTYDSTLATPAVKLYIDHVLVKTWSYNASGDSNDKHITGTISYGDDNAIYIGGYDTYYNSGYGYRRFPGVIDEVRVSSAALTPAQFLRMRPSADTNVILQISFDPDEYERTPSTTKNFNDVIDPDFQKTLYKTSSGSATFDASVKAGATVGCGPADDNGVANAASLHFVTNGTGGGSYLQASAFTSRFMGHSNYTIEFFYKTGGQVRGPTSNRQTLFKMGSNMYLASATLCNESSSGNMGTGGILLSYRDQTLVDAGKEGSNQNRFDSTSDTNLDDGNWHHFAMVIDGDHSEARTYIDGRLSKTHTGYVPAPFVNYSIFIACGYGGAPQQFLDGWMDNFRVTLRALSPDEFLAANPTGTADASLLALFENDYAFTCASNAAYSVTGVGEARTGGVAPTFVQDSRGTLLLDGTNGTVRATNQYSASFNKSRVVFPPSDLFEAESYTVEFVAKFSGIAPTNGVAIAAGAKLAQHAPILRLVRGNNPSDYDWYFFRQSGNASALQMAIGGTYPSWTMPNLVVDGKWHHYALTFEPDEGCTNTVVSLYYDYAKIDRANPTAGTPRTLPRRVEGHKLIIGEGTYDEPNLQFKMDALRFSKGVLDPSQFLGRDPAPFVLVVR